MSNIDTRKMESELARKNSRALNWDPRTSAGPSPMDDPDSDEYKEEFGEDEVVNDVNDSGHMRVETFVKYLILSLRRRYYGKDTAMATPEGVLLAVLNAVDEARQIAIEEASPDDPAHAEAVYRRRLKEKGVERVPLTPEELADIPF